MDLQKYQTDGMKLKDVDQAKTIKNFVLLCRNSFKQKYIASLDYNFIVE